MTTTRYIMGIQSFANQDSGAAIVKCSDDGGILEYIAISEERLIRIKYPYVFPVHSIGYCMDYFGLKSLAEIDLLVTDYIRIERWFNSGPAYNTNEYDYLKIKFNIDPRKIRTIRHHLAHAASAYYTSGFEESAILIVDGNGSDLETTSYFHGQGFQINPLETYRHHGIGACYSAVTNQILNFGTGGEGKTMGLAPYGAPYPKVLDIQPALHGIQNNFSRFMRRMPYSDVLNQIDQRNRINPLRGSYKKCQEKNDLLSPYFSRVAYDVQEATERVLVHLASDLQNKTKSKHLCIAGGVGLNSVSNKIVLDRCGFEKVFVFPACSDAGIPFGLALWGYYNDPMSDSSTRIAINFRNAYLGKAYSNDEIRKTLDEYQIPFTTCSLAQVAKCIADGKIVGWFQGGSEYGPRALGHRSILVDSRKDAMKDVINLRVKHRESFRPFAPAILREYCSEYFDLECASPYMLFIAQVKKPEVIPAVTHVDQTARVQTVTKEDNDLLYDLISEFHRLTGVPCILNTSFNDAGEPIVETPEDAIICFLNTEMDYLVLGPYLLERKSLGPGDALRVKMQKERQEVITRRARALIEQYFSGYKTQERDHFISESNKISEWYAKYKCKYELEKKVAEWAKKGTRVLIVGTKEHTAILPKYITDFGKVQVAGFCEYHKDFECNSDTPAPYPICAWSALHDPDGYDAILVSSYEYNFEIGQRLTQEHVTKPVYLIYDNTSRNFLETFAGFPVYNY